MGCVERLGLSYLALGDWHGQKVMGERVAYSGTPEADGFGVVGQALLVEIDDHVMVTPLETGEMVWHEAQTILPPDGIIDADVLMNEAKPMGLSRLSLWRWRLSGRITPHGRSVLDEVFSRTAPGYCFASILWDDVVPVYSSEDAVKLAPEGALRVAVEDLMVLAQDGDDKAHRALLHIAGALKETGK